MSRADRIKALDWTCFGSRNHVQILRNQGFGAQFHDRDRYSVWPTPYQPIASLDSLRLSRASSRLGTTSNSYSKDFEIGMQDFNQNQWDNRLHPLDRADDSRVTFSPVPGQDASERRMSITSQTPSMRAEGLAPGFSFGMRPGTEIGVRRVGPTDGPHSPTLGPKVFSGGVLGPKTPEVGLRATMARESPMSQHLKAGQLTRNSVKQPLFP
eukprot:CAMPEP_0184319286 /NCGR_PEP_ID=MMETSP1049-20130417/107579_1 /TAXON_ID=77928 /ORGANISM="Proteomonas sulcata, Strain CCMP704" /LENGTH=210 /DNA_ID=CAMNT_0026639369 /DNA_START=183 /DNA_END=815 /DNA_ORIENTATION=-